MTYLSVADCSTSEAGGLALIPQLALPLLIFVVLTLAHGYHARSTRSSEGKEFASGKFSDRLHSSECLPLVCASSHVNQHGRCDWVDAYRFWLVACVVVGHAVSWPINYHGVSKYFLSPLILWMDLFSMPGLALLSGICARGPLTWPRLARLFVGVGLPYLFSRFAKFVMFTSVTCVGAGFNLSGAMKYMGCLSGFFSWTSLSAASDAGIEWYLISLMQWRLAAAFLSWLWPEALLAVSFGIGILSGYFDITPFMYLLDIPGFPLVLSVPHRTMSFLPFFAVGLLVDPIIAQNALRSWPKLRDLARAALLMTFCISIFVVRSGIGLNYFKQGAIGDFNYDYISIRVDLQRPGTWITPPLCGPAYHAAGSLRALRYALCFAMVSLVWASAWPSFPALVEAGRHTMYPYLLHQWPLSKLDPFLFFHPHVKLWILGYTGKTGWLVWAAGLPLSIGFTYFSTSPWIRCIFGPFIEPNWALRALRPQPKGKTQGPIS